MARKSVNRSKSSIIGKDEYNSFVYLKQQTDKFLTTILLGSVVLSHNVDSVDSYSEDSSDYKKRLTFFKTFSMEDDGLDDMLAIKLVRYVCFLRHLAQMINKKSKFSIMSLINPNGPQMNAIVKQLSGFADFVGTIFSEITEVIQSVAKDKQREIEYVESHKQRERFLLQEISNFESLLIIKDEKLLQHELAIASHNKLLETFDRLTKKLLKESYNENELQSILENLMQEIQTVKEELSKLRLLIVEDPVKLDEELMELQKKIEKESTKINDYSAQCSEVSVELQKGKLIGPCKVQFYKSLESLKLKSQRLWNIEQEIVCLNLPKTELIEDTTKEFENTSANIEHLASKIETMERENAALRDEELYYQREIEDLKNKIEMTLLKQDTFQRPQRAEMAKERKRRAKITAKFKKGLADLERNGRKSTEELLEQYRHL